MGMVVINAARTDVANVFTKVQTWRQDGGTAGKDEITGEHNGSVYIWRNFDAGFRLVAPSGGTYFSIQDPAGNEYFRVDNDANANVMVRTGIQTFGGDLFYIGTQGRWAMFPAVYFSWRDAASGGASTDTILGRAAPRVINIAGSTITTPATLRSVPLSPTQLTADADNWAPGVARNYRATTDATPRTVNGLVAGLDGEERFIHNANAVGGANVILGHEVGSSTAANRFTLPGGVALNIVPQDTRRIWYDGTAQRWKV